MRPRQQPGIARRDDKRSAAGSLQVRNRVPGEQKRGLEVGVHHGVPLSLAHLGNLFHQSDAGIAHDNVEPALLRDGLADECRDVHLAADVAMQVMDSQPAE